MEVFLLVIFVWLVIVTVILVKIVLYFRQLSKDVKRGNLTKVLEKVLEDESENTQAITRITNEIAEIKEGNNIHIQKLEAVRFNPFKELGGDHSFSLALLDNMDTGVILTGLHARERTRVYIKKIKFGQSDVDLSSEESKALKLAIKKQ